MEFIFYIICIKLLTQLACKMLNKALEFLTLDEIFSAGLMACINYMYVLLSCWAVIISCYLARVMVFIHVSTHVTMHFPPICDGIFLSSHSPFYILLYGFIELFIYSSVSFRAP